MVDQSVRLELIQALGMLPAMNSQGGRDGLLTGLPPLAINRDPNFKQVDLALIVNQLIQIGRIGASGVPPLLVVVDNAKTLFATPETEVYQKLEALRQSLDRFYAGEPSPPATLPAKPEVLVFKGRDERLALVFLERAIAVGRSVTRLVVPRIESGAPTGVAFGTGWLIAPGVVITNHHVIGARNQKIEPAASPADFTAQAAGVSAWFGYLREETDPEVRCQGAELLASDETLDYALIRLREPDKVADRKPLQIVPQPPTLRVRDRLNIVQHSGGRPLRYAIRNNFYVGIGDSADFIRYLTDTEDGASGSPVLDDVWQVVGLHHNATPVPPEEYAKVPQEPYRTLPEEVASGEVIIYHNEGVAIHAILNRLPPDLRQEIATAQGWA